MTRTPKYPAPAVQHARCWRALSIAHAVFHSYEPGPKTSARFRRHLDKIKRWLVECWLGVSQKPLARPNRLAIDRSLDKLERLILRGPKDSDETVARRWAALVWASLTFLEDVRYTCPEYRQQRCWRYLLQTWTTMAEHLRVAFPGMDEEGTAIYEAAA